MPAKAAELRPTDVKTWEFKGLNEPLVQDRLSFFEKNEFLGLVAKAIDRAMSGGIDGAQLIGSLDLSDEEVQKMRSGEIDLQTIAATSNLIGLVVKVFGAVPEMLEDAYLIFLSIPPASRDRVRRVLRQEMDDDTGFSIFDTFIEQNADTLRDFLPRWWKQVQKAQERLTATTSED